MISLYFGLPGCGKTTMYTKLAVDTDMAIEKDKRELLKVKNLFPLISIFMVMSPCLVSQITLV